ncbi:DoxX family protein [Microbacterium rhizomatis]|uniref:DoxX family protein n=1 Tax=Microbacterium rhizomatis TaxID=1631477 RepID=A0A5J5IVK9_9MICO|nr:DoxX family protein [Microbacterium rhizomatis]KAA9105030.1 DoxX family protein [Microbacterium rhizomatis]
MLIAYWIAAGLLALVSLYAAGLKLLRTKEQLERANGMAWTKGFSQGAIRLIGVAELLGAIGLIVPPLVAIAPILAPVAALGLGVLQIGAAVTHARLGEKPVINVVLVVLAAVAAVTGFLVWA